MMINASRLAAPARFGSSMPPAQEMADAIVKAMSIPPGAQREKIHQFVRTLSLRMASPVASYFSGPTMCLIQGANRLAFTDAFAKAKPECPVVVLDALHHGDDFLRGEGSAVAALFAKGIQGQESVQALLAKGKKPLVILKNVEALTDRAKGDLSELFQTGSVWTGQQRVAMNLNGVQILCAYGAINNVHDEALRNRCALMLDV